MADGHDRPSRVGVMPRVSHPPSDIRLQIPMPKQMLINYVPGEECRIAITDDGKLAEFYQERASDESHVGNIYAGRVTNVEPAIQAVFVDFGLERSGFLHVSDVHPKYFPGKDREEFEKVGSKTPRRERPPIQKCFRRGDRVLVQVLKEGIGTKGPTLTSYLSIPGRYLVMMPYMQRLGVTRKVDDDEARRTARDILKDLSPPDDMGFIVRTAGIGQTKTELKRDLSYLLRLWKLIEKRQKQAKRTGELYAESDLMIRTIRDVFTTEIDRIVVDDATAAKRAQDFLKIASPRSQSKLLLYDDAVPLMHRFGVEPQLRGIQDREVPLPSGGSLVFDQAEALVAIDVNSGKSREARDAETNALENNKEAVDEIARQLRLRDMGGVVVCDLIDMNAAKHRRQIEQRFKAALKGDRARLRVGSISQFGLLELTRQRMRPSLRKSMYSDCDHCHGVGHVRSAESTVLDVMRDLAVVLQRQEVARVELTISPDVAFQVLNRKRRQLTALENRFGKDVLVRVGGRSLDFVQIDAFDERGGSVNPERLFDLRHLNTDDDEVFHEIAGEGISEAVTVEDDDDLPENPEVTPPEAAVNAEDEDHAEPRDDDDDALQRGDGPVSLEALDEEDDTDDSAGGKKKRRRRRRGGRRRRKKSSDDDAQPKADDQGKADDQAGAAAADAPSEDTPTADAEPTGSEASDGGDDSSTESETGDKPKRKRSRSRRKKSKAATQDAADADEAAASTSDDTAPDPRAQSSDADETPADAGGEAAADAEAGEKPKRRRRRRSRKSSTKQEDDAPADHDASAAGYSNRLIDDASAPRGDAEPQSAAETDA